MNILFISRATLYTNPGGDTVQITNTAAYLKESGINVDVRLANEKIQYSSYDLLHFFNIIRPSDIMFHIKASAKPFVVSTIFVDYSEYETKTSTGIKWLVLRLATADAIEYLKVIARLVVNNEKVVSFKYFLEGQKKSIQYIISSASLLLPNSENEYKRLVKRYQVKQRYKVIPNGINSELFKSSSVGTKEIDLVLCVARIEPLKNQLNLIRALRHTEFRLLIIGRPSINHQEYYNKCKMEASSNVTFIDYMPQEKLIEYYMKAKVHVLPSWFETTGLSSLEAAAMGCNVVITDKGDAPEYFLDYAYYCEPESPESILKAVKTAAQNSMNINLPTLIREKYTWYKAAEKTLEAYKMVLLKSGL